MIGFYLRPFCWVLLTVKNGWYVGWIEERNPTKDIGMLNPTYEYAMADVRIKPE
jgi:hypothetical protein